MLIVEDQQVMRRRLLDYLRMAYPDKIICEAESGSSALALCRERRFGVVLMDIQLPDTDGIELTAKIRAMRPGTVVIIVTSHTNDAYVERAKAAGAFAYVTKEMAHRELLPAVKAALELAQPAIGKKDSQ